MWTYVYLKAANETVWNDCVSAAGMFDTNAIICDVIGHLYDAEGNLLDGWHINIALHADAQLPEVLGALEIPTPEHPKRIFA